MKEILKVDSCVTINWMQASTTLTASAALMIMLIQYIEKWNN